MVEGADLPVSGFAPVKCKGGRISTPAPFTFA